ncbi:MFS transporter [Paraburkholderia megapolitana]|uniref:MFS transporter, AAHS family, 4-hydroxybenzoate transporter n=1 Tax=Paraburkholderia megapolitana TaxID=420953 RepID=A0A1I3GFB6_9BURK|nr:MFS transporter [Paraburkholderia megapolitana]QDQ82874.1 MFS transporter [Paraburkholderia megapolitana]SFI21942.1 MFS transporter, AAHS family, 4-hydroxybenzoate transporter [Paraburkholderia megapolitana]
MSAQPASSNVIEVERVLGETHHPAFQLMLLVLCGLCLVIDGFDAQAMGYVAPSVIAEWNVSKAALGPVFSASLFGMLLGALGLSVLADRIGRRPVLIGATFFFAAAMIATPLASTVPALIALRFITGLGLGCIMPNAMALVGEFSTPAHRVKRMMLVSCGFTLGAALGGFVSAALIPAFGWRAVFWVGGAVPLLLAFAMLAALPESLQFLVLKGRTERARRWLATFDPSLHVDAQTRIVVREKADGGAPVAELFRAGRTPVTLILWAISFMNLIDLYFLSNWLPTVMRDAGYTPATAVIVGTVLQTGGVIGTLSLGWFIERFGFVRVLFVCFACAAGFVGAIGSVAHALPWLLVAVFAGGFCVVGGQPAVNALAGHYYPTSLRSTGIGWSLGIGRIGSVIGPLVGGQMIALNWSNAALFHVAAVPVLCSALFVVVLAGATRGHRVASARTA